MRETMSDIADAEELPVRNAPPARQDCRVIADSDAESSDDDMIVDIEEPDDRPAANPTNIEDPKEEQLGQSGRATVQSHATAKSEETGPSICKRTEHTDLMGISRPDECSGVEVIISDNPEKERPVDPVRKSVKNRGTDQVDETYPPSIYPAAEHWQSDAPKAPIVASKEAGKLLIKDSKSLQSPRDIPESHHVVQTARIPISRADQIEEPCLSAEPQRSDVSEIPAAVEHEAEVYGIEDSIDVEPTQNERSSSLQAVGHIFSEVLETSTVVDNEAEDNADVLFGRMKSTKNASKSPVIAQSVQDTTSREPKEDHRKGKTPELPTAELTPEQKRIASLQSRNQSLISTLDSLTIQRTTLLQSLAQNLSPYTPTTIPSVRRPSIASHTTSFPAPITPDDDIKLMAEARQIIKDHIGRLHRYNEIRDVGQGLIGMIADQRGVRIAECYDEFGVNVGD